MKQYLIFAGDKYYPKGGWEDFKFSCDSMPEALEWLANNNQDWWHIVDTHTKTYDDGYLCAAIMKSSTECNV